MRPILVCCDLGVRDALAHAVWSRGECTYLSMRVEKREVGHDDGHGQRDGQHAGERAQRADEHAHVRLGRHVAVPDRRHGDDGPPEPDGDGREVIVRVELDALGVVDERREDDDAEDEEEDEQGEFVRRRLEGVDEDLEPRGVPRQLEEPHDPDDGEELEDIVLLLEVSEQEVQVEAQRRHEVNDVDGGAHELELVVGHDEADDDLEREPRVARALDVEEGLVRLGARLLQGPRRDGAVLAAEHGDVLDDGHAHVRVRLEAEGQDGHDDEEDACHRDDLQREKTETYVVTCLCSRSDAHVPTMTSLRSRHFAHVTTLT